MIGPYLTITVSEEVFSNTNKIRFLLIIYIAMIFILVRSLITYGNGGLLKYAFFKEGMNESIERSSYNFKL